MRRTLFMKSRSIFTSANSRFTLDSSQVQSAASDACLLQRVHLVCQHKPSSLVSLG